MKKLLSMLLLAALVMGMTVTTFASAPVVENDAKALIDSYFAAVVEKDYDVAFSYIMKDSEYDEDILFISIEDTAQFVEIIENDEILSYNIINTTTDAEGNYIVEVALTKNSGRHRSEMHVNLVGGVYKVNLAESVDMPLSRGFAVEVAEIEAVDNIYRQPRAAGTLDWYDFSYLRQGGSLNGIDKFSLTKGCLLAIAGSQYDDEHPNRNASVKLTYSIMVPSGSGNTAIKSLTVTGGGSYNHNFSGAVSSAYSNCYVKIDHLTTSGDWRAKGEGNVGADK